MTLARRDLITLAMAVLVPAGAYLGYFKSRVSRLKGLSRLEADLQQQTADEYKTANDITLVRNNVRKFEKRLSEFIGAIPGQDEAYRAVDVILQSAKEAGVNIELIRPGAPVEGKTLNCLPIDLAASADFAKLYDFLVRIERGKIVITVNNMELESDPLSDRCAVKLQLRVYFGKSDLATRKETRV